MSQPSSFSAYLVGTESLLVQCAEYLLDRGHRVLGVATTAAPVSDWARRRGIPCVLPGDALVAAMRETPADVLFSITNLTVLPRELFGLARRAAVNFHDGPLPGYVGLNTPAWGIINGEREWGISWHLMTEVVDGGALLAERRFEVAPDETSLTLNTKCFAAAVESFGDVVAALEQPVIPSQPQHGERGRVYRRADRPAAAAVLDFRRPAAELCRLVRGLDFGAYANPVAAAKVRTHGAVRLVPRLLVLPERSTKAPGTVVAHDEAGLRIATATDDVLLPELRALDGAPVALEMVERSGEAPVGVVLPPLEAAEARRVDEVVGATARHEAQWVARLRDLSGAELPFATRGAARATPIVYARHDAMVAPALAEFARARGLSAADAVVAAFGAFVARLTGRREFDLAFRDGALAALGAGVEELVAAHVPLRLAVNPDQAAGAVLESLGAQVAETRRRGTYLHDVVARMPELRALRPAPSALALPAGVEVVTYLDDVAATAPAELVLVVTSDGEAMRFVYDRALYGAERVRDLAERFALFLNTVIAEPTLAAREVPLLSVGEHQQLLVDWNATAAPVEPACVHELIERQARLTPDAVALVCGGESLTYRALDARSNQLARLLREKGVGADVLVGLCIERSVAMMVAAIAIHKAGGAYVPLDPTYPRERLAFMASDSRAAVLLTQESLRDRVPGFAGAVLCVDRDWALAAAKDASSLGPIAHPGHLAYAIYTSGSTGVPKGVLVEHRNVVNFFAGMDARIGGDGTPGTWLAVTSMSFDISVLELFWTLARGYTVVVASDAEKPAASAAHAARAADAGPRRKVDFSFFYFASEEQDATGNAYRLLLEGAKFADRNGFSAVWTPERHFHAFGGLYPNPAVTGAAVAAVTEHVQIRSGSVVLPLHHPIRVAEEWAVVDNLSRGRVGISFASGWMPNDFVLRPENYADSKNVMLRDIDVVRRLWRGETLEFPGAMGKPVPVRTLPRPVQAELPFWITTAGNPETFAQAGAMGANLLTHLLGQSVEELTTKLAAYRQAWKDAGHAGEGHVSLMLHTFVSDDPAMVRETVRGPLISYLKSSASLIKGFASVFPAFKKKVDAQGADAAFKSLTDEELDELLAFAFERYYQTSGLFGTPESCEAMVERLRALEVDEIACLIDFGIDSQVVLDNLVHLDALRRRSQAEPNGVADASLPELVARHGVTHLQCTPSLARVLTASPEGRAALGRLQVMMVGGEAFPPALARELRALVPGRVVNMYGPTETTIWSSTFDVVDGDAPVTIGTPIANTSFYVLDAAQQPVPVGVPGELYIGGAGVVRGYHGRPELTAERFVRSPFARGVAERLYRTGDLVRWRESGDVEFLGRIDHQVKVRGFRIELGEIEAALERRPEVLKGVVVAREDTPGDQRLVAYVTARPGQAAVPAALRDALRGQLPEFMVPAHVVVLDALPLTPNGKIDRKALPAPDAAQRTATAAAFVAPSEGLEATIAGIWSEALGVPQVGSQDNFFDLGGHSLLAVQVHRQLRDALQLEKLTITDLFRFPTVRSLCDHIAGTGSGAARVQQSVERADTRREALARRQQLRRR